MNLALNSNKLTDVKGLEKLMQLKVLSLRHNPDLTKAQIDQLQKALPSSFFPHPTNATTAHIKRNCFMPLRLTIGPCQGKGAFIKSPQRLSQ